MLRGNVSSQYAWGTPPASSLLDPVDPSFRALSGRLKFTVRRPKFNKILSCVAV